MISPNKSGGLPSFDPLQNWVAGLDRRAYAILIGAIIGIVGGGVGLLVTLADPVLAFGAVIGVLAGLYILTSLNTALYALIAIVALLPFATFPVKIVFTPTLIDLALGAFLLVYAFQWMTGKRRGLRLTWVHGPLLLYMGWLLLCFALGLRYAMPTSNILRQFAETLLAIGMVFVLVDLLKDAAALRRLALVMMIFFGLQALVTLGLYVLPNEAAERTLIRLARLGYPNGGVIRYIEDNPALAERAIGTWVDPNAMGGVLAIAASMIAPQLFAEKPILRPRFVSWGLMGAIALGLFLTYSRASMLGFGVGLLYIAVLRYRKVLPVMALGLVAVLVLPQTQPYVERFLDAFTASDLATQMRIGEYTDSLRLISRYPVFGIGFTGTPEIDIYSDVASMYLIMANQIGLVGVAIFLTTMGSIFVHGLRSWRQVKANPDLNALHLGFHAALLTALVNGVADLYFFRTDFQASIMLFWLVVSFAIATARLAAQPRLTVANPSAVL